MNEGCPNEETLSRYHDGEMESAEIAVHLAECSVCAVTLEKFERVDALTREAGPPSKVGARSPLAFVMATAAALAVCAGFWLHQTPDPKPTAQRYQISSEGRDYVVSVEGDGYLVSMQIGDVVRTYEKDEK